MKRIGFIIGAKNERLPFYFSEFLSEEQAKDVEVVCFSLSDINFILMTVPGTVVDYRGIREKETPLPHYIFNFILHTKPSSIKALRQLRTMPGYKVINPINRFHQGSIYDMVRSFPQSEEFLLPYGHLEKEAIRRQLEKSDILYLLPERGIHVEGAIRVQKEANGLIRILAGHSEVFCTQKELYGNLIMMTMGKAYLSMEGIPVRMRNDLPLEAGVYLLKNPKGQWQTIFHIAKNELFSCGSVYEGYPENLEYFLFEEIPQEAEVILERIRHLSVMICGYLDFYIMDMASVRLDFLISENRKPYLLTFRGCEQNFPLVGEDVERTYCIGIVRYMLHTL